MVGVYGDLADRPFFSTLKTIKAYEKYILDPIYFPYPSFVHSSDSFIT